MLTDNKNKSFAAALLTLIFLLTLLLSVFPLMSVGAIEYNYADVYEYSDQLMRRLVAEEDMKVLDEHGITYTEEHIEEYEKTLDIFIDYKPLYDYRLNVIGCLAEYVIKNDYPAYAFFVKYENDGVTQYAVTEVYPRGVSPYLGLSGYCVYPGTMTYLLFDGEVFVDVRYNEAISYEEVEEMSEAGFGIKNDLSEADGFYDSEYIGHTQFDENTSYNVNETFPAYDMKHLASWINGVWMEDHCAPTAGTMIMAYFDRWCPELVPGAKTYYEEEEEKKILWWTVKTTKYVYYKSEMGAGSEALKEVCADLYERMGTNKTLGTLAWNIYPGLKSYVQSKGYVIDSEEINIFMDRWDNCTKAINRGKLLILALNNYRIINRYTSGDGYYNTVGNKSLGGHAVVGWGYKKLSFKDADGKPIRTDRLIRVSDGWGDHGYVSCDTNMLLVRTINIKNA